MEKISLKKGKRYTSFVKRHSKYFTHGKGRFLVAGKWEEKGFSVFSFGEDISIKYNEDSDICMALELLMQQLEKGNKGIIKIRRQ